MSLVPRISFGLSLVATNVVATKAVVDPLWLIKSVSATSQDSLQAFRYVRGSETGASAAAIAAGASDTFNFTNGSLTDGLRFSISWSAMQAFYFANDAASAGTITLSMTGTHPIIGDGDLIVPPGGVALAVVPFTNTSSHDAGTLTVANSMAGTASYSLVAVGNVSA